MLEGVSLQFFMNKLEKCVLQDRTSDVNGPVPFENILTL